MYPGEPRQGQQMTRQEMELPRVLVQELSSKQNQKQDWK